MNEIFVEFANCGSRRFPEKLIKFFKKIYNIMIPYLKRKLVENGGILCQRFL